MQKEEPIKALKPKAKWIITYSILPIALIILSFYQTQNTSKTLTSIGLYAFTILSILGLVELLNEKVTFYPSRIVIWKTFEKMEIGIDEIREVYWQKGCQCVLIKNDGEKISIPNPGTTNQGITNSIKAWMKTAQPGIAHNVGKRSPLS
ncbi:hypothetical protein VDG1235_952 [Verrucomicrobiia bacterium DG1235]|nr:hypothetical protein VDG1235_952 [Verrucomicrobiae bacterium DG1235]